jgi:hypothetical protein
VLQLQKVHREFLAELARRSPVLPGKDTLAFIDIASQQKRVYGHHKQGAASGYTKIQGKSPLVRGLNVLAASVCTPLAPRLSPAPGCAAGTPRPSRRQVSADTRAGGSRS